MSKLMLATKEIKRLKYMRCYLSSDNRSAEISELW